MGSPRCAGCALLDEYRDLVHRPIDVLTPANHDVCVQAAALPDMVRTYKHIKLDNVRRYRERRGGLLRLLDQTPSRPAFDLALPRS